MALAGLLNALLAIAGLLAFGTLLGLAMIWAALSLSGEGMKVDAEANGAGGRKAGRRPSGTTKRTQQSTDPFALGTGRK
jgi:hypothetical protein